MRRLLLASAALFIFSFSLSLVQLSCSESADASPTMTEISQLNKIIVCRTYSTDAEIWIANYDGTEYNKINITLPTGIRMLTPTEVRLSPDGQTVFFNVAENNTIVHIYSCKLDGTNLKKVISGSNSDSPFLRGAY